MSIAPAGTGPVVFTNKARCRDCYRCVRVCPVKAIRMHDGQANVVEVALHQLRHLRSRVPAEGQVVSPRPGPGAGAVAAGRARGGQRGAVVCRRLSRLAAPPAAVGLAAAGVRLRGRDGHRRLSRGRGNRRGRRRLGRGTPTSARPARPWSATSNATARSWSPNLVPVVSPMLAHARHIRQSLPTAREVRVVFIGPCVAKKAEADRPEHEGLVDCVLDLCASWTNGSGRRASIWPPARRATSTRCRRAPRGCFPWKAAACGPPAGAADMLADSVVAASGFDEICTVLDSIAAGSGPQVVEPLFCPQGCINGPAMPGDRNLFLCRQRRAGLRAAREPAIRPVADLPAMRQTGNRHARDR